MSGIIKRNSNNMSSLAESKPLTSDVPIMSSHTIENSSSAFSTSNFRHKLIQFKNAFKSRNAFVDILLIFFGIGSWIGINSTFLQMPLMVETAPEGWRLPSFITMTIQIGNIGPILYTIVQKLLTKKIPDANIIYGVKIVGAISSLLMAFFYDKTLYVGSNEYSVALLALVFFLAVVACTSSVLFMPYMGRFKEIYLVTYLIGEGVSGLVPSLAALIQGVGGAVECVWINGTNPPEYEPKKPPPPVFTTLEFFIFIFTVMLCSLIAFILLENLNVCKSEYAAVRIGYGNTYEYINEGALEENHRIESQKTEIKCLEKKEYNYILMLLAAISFIGNGVLPSIQSFSCMPYGQMIYHLTVSLTLIANPFSCLLAMFLPHSKIRLILVLIGCFCATSTYIIFMAALSPNPPMIDTGIGGILVITIWTLHTAIFSYIKLCITTLMRSQGGNSLVWTGGIAQAGTAVGSLFIFAIVNYTKAFVSADPCSVK